MPPTSVTKDPATLTLSVVGDYPVSVVDPISWFEALDGEDNVEDGNMPEARPARRRRPRYPMMVASR